jgi:hypothetical protein
VSRIVADALAFRIASLVLEASRALLGALLDIREPIVLNRVAVAHISVGDSALVVRAGIDDIAERNTLVWAARDLHHLVGWRADTGVSTSNQWGCAVRDTLLVLRLEAISANALVLVGVEHRVLEKGLVTAALELALEDIGEVLLGTSRAGAGLVLVNEYSVLDVTLADIAVDLGQKTAIGLALVALRLLEVVAEALVEVVDVAAGLADTRLAIVGDVGAGWAGDTLAVQSARSKSWAFALSGLTLTLGLSTVDITSAAPGLGGLVNVSSLGASIRLAEVALKAATLRALAFLVRVLKLAVLASAGIRFAICTLDEIGIARAEGDTLAGVGVRDIALDTLALLLGVFTNELSLLVVADTAAATLEG